MGDGQPRKQCSRAIAFCQVQKVCQQTNQKEIYTNTSSPRVSKAGCSRHIERKITPWHLDLRSTLYYRWEIPVRFQPKNTPPLNILPLTHALQLACGLPVSYLLICQCGKYNLDMATGLGQPWQLIDPCWNNDHGLGQTFRSMTQASNKVGGD